MGVHIGKLNEVGVPGITMHRIFYDTEKRNVSIT
jgi:hypothetical protein